jgi:hypothetical protein
MGRDSPREAVVFFPAGKKPTNDRGAEIQKGILKNTQIDEDASSGAGIVSLNPKATGAGASWQRRNYPIH